MTSGVWADLEALRILRSASGTWGFLLGHVRGSRFFVERAFPAGRAAVPAAGPWAGLDKLWDGSVLGVFAHRPSASFKKRLLEPRFFGKLYLEAGISANRVRPKAYTVEHKGGFRFSALPLRPKPKDSKRG